MADIAKFEAESCFHGAVMQMEPNLLPIVELFPKWSVEEADGMWCAAFVYYCCKRAGFKIPIKPKGCGASLAGCLQWEEWAMGDEDIGYYPAECDGFSPQAGDIVLFDKVFINQEHDHIGIVLENKETSIMTAEGNINNVSGVVRRKKDGHIRAYIRIPDGYECTQGV
jgi:hypothetical protein